MKLIATSYIGYTRGKGKTLCSPALNPASGELILPAPTAATDREIERALALASSAFQPYQNLSGKCKAQFLREIAKNIKAELEQLIYLGEIEAALSAERIRTETARTIHQLELFAVMAEEGSWVDATINPPCSPEKPDLRSMLHPLGPVVVFPAGNFPLAYSVAGGDTASALAAGCPVIVKAHPAHPAMSEVVATCVSQAAQDLKLPEGVFSMLYGEGHTLGEALVRAEQIQAVAFTGSLKGGRALMDIAASRAKPIPVFAEMGSTNPVVFTAEALAQHLEQTCRDYVASLTQGVGQFCTNPGLVLLPQQYAETFFEQFLTQLKKVPAATMLNSATFENYQTCIAQLVEVPDITVISHSHSEKNNAVSPFITTASPDTFLANPILHQEIFGPAAIIVPYASLEELAELLHSLTGQLTASLHCPESHLELYKPQVDILTQKAGRVILNGFPTGIEVNASTVHGGPYPASSNSSTSSLGHKAIYRFARPVCYQNFPQATLPQALQDHNPLGIQQRRANLA